MGTENKYTIKMKKRKQISDSVFNLLFKDLVESEKIKLYIDDVKQRIYEGEMNQNEFNESLSNLTDRYVKKGLHRSDQASVIRYISAFAKIENNVKANLRVMSMQEKGIDSEEETEELNVQEIIRKYEDTQRWINEWVREYACTHGLDPELVATPNLELTGK